MANLAPAQFFSASYHSQHSSTYDRAACNATLSIALQILPLLPPITSTSYILDNSCGTGLVTSVMKQANPSVPILGADLAPGMIEIYKARAKQMSWNDVTSIVSDCRDLKGVEDSVFSHVVTNFGFAPDPKDLKGPLEAAKAMWRVLKPGGCAAVSIWKDRNFNTAFEKAALRVRPNETPFQWPTPAGWDEAPWLKKQFLDAGFKNAEVTEVHGGSSASSVEEYAENLMLFKDMFYKGYGEEEIVEVEKALKAEIQKLGEYYEREGEVGVKMISWVCIATK